MSPISILLVDDHPIVRSGIQGVLEKSGDIKIVGEAENGEEALQLTAELHPDIILLDMELPDIQGTQVAKKIREMHPEVKLLVLSAHDDVVYIRGLMELGAAGYLIKEEAPKVIVEAVRGVAVGQKGWVSRRVAARIAEWMETGKSHDFELTQREQEILSLVVQGKTNQGIAVELGISEKTVEKYMSEIFIKLNVTSRIEAAVCAVREGLV